MVRKSPTSKPAKNNLNLVEKILRRRAKIGVIGLGYVGLPLAVAFARAGFTVTGLEIDPERLQALHAGQNYLPDLDDEEVADLVRKKKLKATDRFSVLKNLDAISICVPTPLRKTREPNISYILEATEQIRRNLRKDQIIVLESTTYPGTTEEVLLPAFEERGFRVGKDFYLAFSPERIDPGNLVYQLKNTPKILGGITRRCTKMATLLYHTIIDQVVPVTNARTAEMIKLLENTFRAVNIGLANECALICDRLGISAWEVTEGASTKPFGFMPFQPGPGLGGHCLPVDPQYLSWKLKSLNYNARFIELGTEVNQEMPLFVFQKIQRALNERRLALKGAKIMLLGVAYKKNVSDTRESPAHDVGNYLREAGARLSYSDPFVPLWETDWGKLKSQRLTAANLKKQDCLVLLTHHDAFPLADILKHAKLVVDTRGATRNLPQKKVILL